MDSPMVRLAGMRVVLDNHAIAAWATFRPSDPDHTPYLTIPYDNGEWIELTIRDDVYRNEIGTLVAVYSGGICRVLDGEGPYGKVAALLWPVYAFFRWDIRTCPEQDKYDARQSEDACPVCALRFREDD